MKTSNKLLIALGSLLLIAILVILISVRVMLNTHVDFAAYSGDIITIEKKVNSFSKIDLRKLDDVTITMGDQYIISITAPSDLSENVTCEVKNGKLRIVTPSSYAGKSVDVDITIPNLTDLFTIDVDYISISGFNEDYLVSEYLGGTTVDGFDNVIENLDIKSTGAAKIDFMDSEITNADLNITGAGLILLNMKGGNLTGKALGAASIEYSGEAQNTINTSGAVKVRHR